MNAEQRARALRLADLIDVANKTGLPEYGADDVVEFASDAAALLRELAAEPECQWPSCKSDEYKRALTDHIIEDFIGKPVQKAEPERVPLTDELSVSPQEVTEALRFVRTHLYAAQAQAVPGDDSIIMRHVYDAYRRIADLTKEVELHGIGGGK